LWQAARERHLEREDEHVVAPNADAAGAAGDRRERSAGGLRPDDGD